MFSLTNIGLTIAIQKESVQTGKIEEHQLTEAYMCITFNKCMPSYAGPGLLIS